MIAFTWPVTPQVHRWRYEAALAGTLPGEALRPKDCERLITDLLDLGWTDLEIACHTRWSTYTVVRIRERLGLAANPDIELRKAG